MRAATNAYLAGLTDEELDGLVPGFSGSGEHWFLRPAAASLFALGGHPDWRAG